ncbi:MAG: RNA-binding domain-containing protein [Desulfurococcaceae archaeon]
MASSGEAKGERRAVEAFKVEISAFCHATEDCFRVEEAIRNLFPSDLNKKIVINTIKEEGYYGNPIHILSVKVRDPLLVDQLLKHLAESLEPIEKSILKATFNIRYDTRGNRLIIRFSKQDLYQGVLKISDTDDIVKLTIHFRKARNPNIVVDYLKHLNIIS